MSGIADNRARHAASILVVASATALAVLGRGKADPEDPMCWNDEEAWSAYVQLAIAIDVAGEQNLGRSPLTLKTCQSCRYHLVLQRGRGDLEPRAPDSSDGDMGFCGRFPPARVSFPGKPLEDPGHSAWPAVRSGHRCGEWQGFKDFRSRM